MFTMKKQNTKGFTLIELLVVIAIIGILSSIVIASLVGTRDKAKRAKIQDELAAARTQAGLYVVENGDYTGICSDPVFKNIQLSFDKLGNDFCSVGNNGSDFNIGLKVTLNDVGEIWCTDETTYLDNTLDTPSTGSCPN
jgi:prepilin-type N-terminal cleavage/methylation domain-containing protein